MSQHLGLLRPKKITERGVKVASVDDNSFRAPPGCAMHLDVLFLAEGSSTAISGLSVVSIRAYSAVVQGHHNRLGGVARSSRITSAA
jgi:hypothetical protein